MPRDPAQSRRRAGWPACAAVGLMVLACAAAGNRDGRADACTAHKTESPRAAVVVSPAGESAEDAVKDMLSHD